MTQNINPNSNAVRHKLLLIFVFFAKYDKITLLMGSRIFKTSFPINVAVKYTDTAYPPRTGYNISLSMYVNALDKHIEIFNAKYVIPVCLNKGVQPLCSCNNLLLLIQYTI